MLHEFRLSHSYALTKLTFLLTLTYLSALRDKKLSANGGYSTVHLLSTTTETKTFLKRGLISKMRVKWIEVKDSKSILNTYWAEVVDMTAS